MTYAELIFELRRLQSVAEEVDFDLATDLGHLLLQYDTPQGDCCG